MQFSVAAVGVGDDNVNKIAVRRGCLLDVLILSIMLDQFSLDLHLSIIQAHGGHFCLSSGRFGSLGTLVSCPQSTEVGMMIELGGKRKQISPISPYFPYR